MSMSRPGGRIADVGMHASYSRPWNRASKCAFVRGTARVYAQGESNDDHHQGSSASLRKHPLLYSEADAVPSLFPTERQVRGEDINNVFPENEEDNTKAMHVSPEVLAPAGGWAQAHAAVENGADAVYFGVEALNARARAENFGVKDLQDLMIYLHERGVKGYLTLNILVFDDELSLLAETAQAAAAAGVDAVIVQDIGAVEVIKAVAPGLKIHGSTQMSVTDPYGAAFAAKLGVERVVVGRELSIRDLNSFSHPSNDSVDTHTGKLPDIEAFVHGALCVSYSGQCFSSEAWGGRSANRGQCAQACRLDYGMLVDGSLKSMGDVQYLLSPQDLAAVDLIPEMMKAGVRSFKIEGRLKGPEYVAMTTKAYRKAVDGAWSRLASSSSVDPLLTARERQDLHQVFARGQDAQHRGLTPGFLLGPRHQMLVRGRAPKHRGVYLGEVEAVIKLETVPDDERQKERLYPEAEMNSPGSKAFDAADRSQSRNTTSRSPTRGRPRKGPEFLKFETGIDQDSNSRIRSQKGQRNRNKVHEKDSDERTVYLTITCKTNASIRRGDGVVLDQGDPRSDELGGVVYSIARRPRGGGPLCSNVLEVPAGTRINLTIKIMKGNAVRYYKQHRDGAKKQSWESSMAMKKQALLWKTKDSTLERRLRDSYESIAAADRRRVPVSVSVVCTGIGSPLTINIYDERNGVCGSAQTPEVAEKATGRATTQEDIIKAIGVHLGDDGSLCVLNFDFGKFHGLMDMECEQRARLGFFIPARAIKDARRRAVADFIQQQRMLSVISSEDLPDVDKTIHSMIAEIRKRSQDFTTGANFGSDRDTRGQQDANSDQFNDGLSIRFPKLRVLCRTPSQVEAAIRIPWLQDIIVDFLEVHGLKEHCEMVHAAGKRITVATPRILKPDERRLWLFYLKLGADALLIRSTGLLHHLIELGGPGATVPIDTHGTTVRIPNHLEGDFSLNVSNTVSADLFLNLGLSALAPTHDCNASQLAGLAQSLGGRSTLLEAIVHTNLPVFHTEHCVFARFLSNGNSYKDCGHPCENHVVHLRAPDGSDHLVLADMGCRNTVFSAQAQSAIKYLKPLLQSNYGTFRIELVDQPGDVVRPLLEAYRTAIKEELVLSRQMTRAMKQGDRLQKDAGERHHQKIWQWLQRLPDANGNAQGVGLGSLEVKREMSREFMKPTAAALKSSQSKRKR